MGHQNISFVRNVTMTFVYQLLIYFIIKNMEFLVKILWYKYKYIYTYITD